MLRPCPECKKEVSERSVTCPNCGYTPDGNPPIELSVRAINSSLYELERKLEQTIINESKNLREEIKNSKASFSLDGTSVETLAQLILFVLGLAFIFAVITYCKAH